MMMRRTTPVEPIEPAPPLSSPIKEQDIPEANLEPDNPSYFFFALT